MPMGGLPDGESCLNRSRQVLYWKRCLKTFLPHHYTSNDSSRLTLAFFTVSALDLLDDLQSSTTVTEREEHAKWIYHNQHPDGGFRGSPAMDLGGHRNDENGIWDPANIPATYFALLALLVLGDNLERVKRRECLEWLTRMQRADGSFGETLGENGILEGGADPRSLYCASAIRWVLRGSREGLLDGIPDINVDKLVERIRNSETYTGGISEGPFHEAHAGFTYCAISALSLVNRLHYTTNSPPPPPSMDRTALHGLAEPDLTIHWLVSRQTLSLRDDGSTDTNDDKDGDSSKSQDTSTFVNLTIHPVQATKEFQPPSNADLQWAGFNGRCNKLADTCYSFWVCGSLAELKSIHLINHIASRRYLLDKTQHLIGGFGKLPGYPPDIYHSYLGLASLAIMEEEGLKPLNAALCVSQDTITHLESLVWRREIVGEQITARQATGTF